MFGKKAKNESVAEQAEPVTSRSTAEVVSISDENGPKKPWWSSIKEPGSAFQIIIAALLAIAIGMIVTTQVDEVPEAARVLISIPGDLWLRSLKAIGMFPILILTFPLVQGIRVLKRT